MDNPATKSMTVNERFFGMLGLARRAGKTVLGTAMICEKMRANRKPVLVLVAHDASEATRKRLRTKCSFYSVPFREVAVSTEKLGNICGSGGLLAAVAITDGNFAEQLLLECK